MSFSEEPKLLHNNSNNMGVSVEECKNNHISNKEHIDLSCGKITDTTQSIIYNNLKPEHQTQSKNSIYLRKVNIKKKKKLIVETTNYDCCVIL